MSTVQQRLADAVGRVNGSGEPVAVQGDLPKPTPSPEDAARATLEAARKAERDACGAAVKAALEKHRCRLRVVQVSLDGQPLPASVEIVDA